MGGVTEFPIIKKNKSWSSEANSKPVYLNNCETILDNLEYHARDKSELCVYRFVNEKGVETDTLTFADLNNQTGRISEVLQYEYGVKVIYTNIFSLSLKKKGDRVLLVFFPGIEFIVAFFACLKIGAIAVPAYPPVSNDSIPILLHVINNSQVNTSKRYN